MNFEEYWNDDGALSSCSRDDAEDFYNAGQQSKIDELQAKIGILQIKLNGANERAMMVLNHKNVMVDKMQAKIDELQGRIDDASNKIDFWVGGKNGDAIHVAKSIGNILKGNKDEKWNRND